MQVNIKLLEVGDLQPVSDSQTFQISYNGSNYLVSQYFDESYVVSNIMRVIVAKYCFL